MNRTFIIMISFSFVVLSCSKIPEADTILEKADINPQYTQIIIPYNIAPLNFVINNTGSEYIVHIHGNNSNDIKIHSKTREISIPEKSWKKLISENINKEICFDIYMKRDGKWLKCQTIANTVSEDKIDPYIAYRKIGSANILWNNMGIYQTCLENYRETPIMTNNLTNKGCMNCHSFNKNDPSQMVLHMREIVNGTVIINKNKKQFVNTATNYTMSSGVYPSWHPSGKYIAFSVNKIYQIFPAQIGRYAVVEDKASDLILLNNETNTITTSPKVSTSWLENTPSWSPDGKYLYYISAEKKDDSFEKTKYSLLRISFDINTNEWGEADTLLSSKVTGKSITFPRVSPDGKYVIFCMTDHGYFTVYDPNSDIYIMNLENKEYYKLPVNSEYIESYPSWSSNGRWILFVSKRTDNMYSCPWFCHFDENGRTGKPFVMPQKKPDFYKTYIKNYNRPEFIKGKVDITPEDIYQLTSRKADSVKFDTNVDISALSGATRISTSAAGHGLYLYE